MAPKFCNFGSPDASYHLTAVEHENGIFEYRPLPTDSELIRVVQICEDLAPVSFFHNGAQNEELTIKLQIQELNFPSQVEESSEQVEAYNALSYVWGDARDMVPIVMDSLVTYITRNLYEALQRLWLWTFEPRAVGVSKAVGFGHPLWIDALCINQTDLVEKSAQVQRMGDIYRHAGVVYIWLGSQDEQVSQGVSDTIFRLDTRQGDDWDPCPRRADGSSNLVDLDTAWATESARKNLIEHLDPLMELLSYDGYERLASLEHFAELPYWKRAWVVQEAALANQNQSVIMYGCSLVSWANLVNACHVLKSLMYLVNHNKDWPIVREWDQVHLMRLRIAFVSLNESVSCENGSDVPLHELLPRALFRPTEASLAVDHVYSLLSMATDRASCGITPDYTASTANAYKEVATYLMTKSGANALSFCELCRTRSLGLPSWIPNFSRHAVMTLRMPNPSQTDGRMYSAGGKAERFDWTVDKLCLHVWGRKIDTITGLGKMPKQDIEESHSAESLWYYSVWLQAFDSFVYECSKQHGAEILTEAWRVPIADQYSSPGGKQMRAPSSLRSGYNGVLHYAGTESVPQKSKSRPRLRQLVGKYRLAFGQHRWEAETQQLSAETGVYGDAMTAGTYGRWPFVTRSGRLGLGPRCNMAGNIICVFDGAETPMILMPNEDGTEYRIVGEAYFWD